MILHHLGDVIRVGEEVARLHLLLLRSRVLLLRRGVEIHLVEGGVIAPRLHGLEGALLREVRTRRPFGPSAPGFHVGQGVEVRQEGGDAVDLVEVLVDAGGGQLEETAQRDPGAEGGVVGLGHGLEPHEDLADVLDDAVAGVEEVDEVEPDLEREDRAGLDQVVEHDPPRGRSVQLTDVRAVGEELYQIPSRHDALDGGCVVGGFGVRRL